MPTPSVPFFRNTTIVCPFQSDASAVRDDLSSMRAPHMRDRASSAMTKRLSGRGANWSLKARRLSSGFAVPRFKGAFVSVVGVAMPFDLCRRFLDHRRDGFLDCAVKVGLGVGAGARA